MTDPDAVAVFKEGVDLLKHGYPQKAVVHFRRVVEFERRNPYYLSFLGVSIARAERKWADALDFCETALQLKRGEAQFYLNLAEVYASAGRRENALDTLDAALERFGRDVRLKRARSRLGRRRSPVLPFLNRENFLNKNLGELRHRMFKRLHKSESI